MTTAVKNTVRDIQFGNKRFIKQAVDVLFEGSAGGVTLATGHVHPIVAGDRFVGFAERKTDNAFTGAVAGGVDGRLIDRGSVLLDVSGLVITDVGQDIYMSDDLVAVFTPTGNSFVGKVNRWVADGSAWVDFAPWIVDPYRGWTIETISANKTLDIEDNGKLFWVDTDAVVFTLPATTTGVHCKITNGGAYSTVGTALSPNSSDKIFGPNLDLADNTDLTNTKATAQRGDSVVIKDGHADGYAVIEKIGVWA